MIIEVDGNLRKFLEPQDSDKTLIILMLSRIVLVLDSFQETASCEKTVPKTDSGGLVEYTKALWMNHTEGTRQNDSVTSGERVLV